MTISSFRFDVGHFLRLIIASICLLFIAALVLAQTPEADKQVTKARWTQQILSVALVQ